jgi:hypothetical protein
VSVVHVDSKRADSPFQVLGDPRGSPGDASD